MFSFTSRHDDSRYLWFAATLIIASILLSPGLLLGQAYFGTVSGVLTDSTGAVLAHADVEGIHVQDDHRWHRVVFVPVDSAGAVFGNGGDGGIREDGAP
jgi:hypothetical protein